MKALKSPNIVKIYNSISSYNEIYIITEFCNNGDLRAYINNNDDINEITAIKHIR